MPGGVACLVEFDAESSLKFNSSPVLVEFIWVATFELEVSPGGDLKGSLKCLLLKTDQPPVRISGEDVEILGRPLLVKDELTHVIKKTYFAGHDNILVLVFILWTHLLDFLVVEPLGLLFGVGVPALDQLVNLVLASLVLVIGIFGSSLHQFKFYITPFKILPDAGICE